MNYAKLLFLRRFMILAFVIIYSCGLFAQQLAFPGAEGFGRYTTGGRGGEIYHVTNLNDTGAGSFRDAVSQSNRTVVFDVGGVIPISSRIVIKENITVAGQTAPGGGITIYGNGIALNGDSGNDIIRYIRIRMGKNGDSQKDAVSISAGQNYIFDHVSISWGRDGTLDVNGSGIDNLTFQDCIISQGINNTNHSTGGLMQSGKWSVIRSLYIDNKTRNPKARGTHEFINSVLYNWREHGYIMGDTQGLSECNLIGNYFIYGPSSNTNTHITGTTAAFRVYAEDNWVDQDKDGTLDGSLLVDYKTATVVSSPYSHPGVINQLSAQDALSHIIDQVGASKVRDAVDHLLIAQLTSYGTQGQIINTEDDNGIPGNVGTVANGSPPTDSDQDGMSDEWENENGLNPYVADHNEDQDGDGFTNIEEYIDWISNEENEMIAVTGVTLTPDFANPGIGEVVQLVEMVLPSNATNRNVIWSSSNAEVASVNTYGLVTGHAEGSATITVSTSDGGYSASSQVSVSGGSAVPVTIQENEAGFESFDGVIESNNAGYTGQGFINTPNATGQGINWQVCVLSPGTYTLSWRYANGGATDRAAQVLIDGALVDPSVSFLSSGAWINWTHAYSLNVTLTAGTHTIRLESTQSGGLANLDRMTIWGNNLEVGVCPSTTFELTTSINGQGSVSPSDSRTYPAGSMVSLSATPASGWQFDGWSGDGSGFSNPLTLTMTRDKSIIANFSEVGGTVTLTIQENEMGFCGVDGTIDSNHSGFTGSGFANADNVVGSGINWSVNVPSSGIYRLSWRMANGGATDRTAQLLVNGVTEVTTVSFPYTGGWSSWVTPQGVDVLLSQGINQIKLEAITSSGLANIDHFSIEGSNTQAVSCANVARVSKSNPFEGLSEGQITSLKLYPNPASEKITIELSEEIAGEVFIELYDSSGKLLMKKSINGDTCLLDVSHLKPGLYQLMTSGLPSKRVIRISKH